MESSKFHLPRFNELPRVPLYKDQVITYLEDVAKSINVNTCLLYTSDAADDTT